MEDFLTAIIIIGYLSAWPLITYVIIKILDVICDFVDFKKKK